MMKTSASIVLLKIIPAEIVLINLAQSLFGRVQYVLLPILSELLL